MLRAFVKAPHKGLWHEFAARHRERNHFAGIAMRIPTGERAVGMKLHRCCPRSSQPGAQLATVKAPVVVVTPRRWSCRPL
jgi:hypothetical protein